MLGVEGSTLMSYMEQKPMKVKRRARKGILPQFRGLAWFILSGGRALMANSGIEGQNYTAILQKATGRDKTSDEAIMRDLDRTFPTNLYFMDRQGKGQLALYNILRAYSSYDPKVGYVQGMSYIVAVLLVHMNEEQAFWSFSSLMQGGQLTAAMSPAAAASAGQGSSSKVPASSTANKQQQASAAAPEAIALRGMFTEGMPLLQLSLFQWQGLLESELPKLAFHLKTQGLDPSLFGTHWFNTLFSYTLPFHHLVRIWDVYMVEGIKIVFRVALTLMKLNASKLLAFRFEGLVDVLSSKKVARLLGSLSPNQLLQAALKIPVSSRLKGKGQEWKSFVQNSRP
ncbi:hypothetical protein CEUSTIGMA_g6856.t1 [Chlamydomonas eustigma]|uniref:Rab-GAP TBC domain-containing protein n=1 Tax=Chlamydomonas eustigma TaxID=1157962 RepID=A0A250X8L7_9CHLO|nr:hypothetical protein CEUSTIGMA_g6856.t1 [Chlamydomonas eustigma]|eukprot:GAX79415.1 hypothetical protein CEUSTIGMA_g6856.t1 [Chlamydomonas eustigma]